MPSICPAAISSTVSSGTRRHQAAPRRPYTVRSLSMCSARGRSSSGSPNNPGATKAVAQGPGARQLERPKPWSRSFAKQRGQRGDGRCVEDRREREPPPRRSAICWNNGAVRVEVPPHSRSRRPGRPGRPAQPPDPRRPCSTSPTGPASRAGRRPRLGRRPDRAIARRRPGFRARRCSRTPGREARSVAATSEYFPLCVTGSSGTSTITAGTWAGDASRASAVRMRREAAGRGRGRVRSPPAAPSASPLCSPASAVRPPSRRRSRRTIRARDRAPAGPMRMPRTFIVPSLRPCMRGAVLGHLDQSRRASRRPGSGRNRRRETARRPGRRRAERA